MSLEQYSTYQDPEYHLIEAIWDDDAERGSIPKLNGSYYKDGLLNKTVPAATTVISTIDWHRIPDETLPKSLQHARGASHPAEVRDGVRRYTRYRGELVHSDILDVEIIHPHILDEPRENPFTSDDVDWKTVQQYLARSEITTAVKNPDESLHEPSEALHRAAKQEASQAALNWKRMSERESLWPPIAQERKIVTKTDDVWLAGQIDLLAEKEDELLLFEFKTGGREHPGHILQAEAYRRAITEKLEKAIDAVLVRLGVRDGDIETRSSRDWQCGEVWDVFRKRYKQLRRDDVFQLQLENASR